MKLAGTILGILFLLLALVMPHAAKELPANLILNSPQASHPAFFEMNESALLLDDVNFPFRPEFFDFDIQAFLKERASPLASYNGPMFSSEENVSGMLEFVAHYHGINPKVLLTAIEVQAELVNHPSLDRLESWVLGYQPRADEVQDGLDPGDGKLLFSQFILLARRLNEGYFNWRDSQEETKDTYSTLTLADGSQHTVPVEINAATFAILYALAEVNYQES